MATPSVAMIPSGYKDGTLYNVLPNNAAGDFDVTRGSLATRVNESGLIEPVGTLGADVVLNGDFEETGADQILNGDFSQEGSDVILNGDFATDSDWNLVNSVGSSTNISGGSLNIVTDGANTQANQANILTSGKSYAVNYTVTSSSGVGSLAIVKGASAVVIPKNVGTHTFYFESESTVFAFKRGGGALNVSIDNVSVVEVGQNWSLTNNVGSSTNISDTLNIVTDGAYTQAAQDNSLTPDKHYVLNYTVTSVSVVGSLAIVKGSSTLGVPSTVGAHTVYFQSDGGGFAFKRGGDALNVSITNITVEEVGQEWTTTAGCTITDKGARITSDGTYQDISQGSVFEIGDTYEIEYEITESVSGTIAFTSNFGNLQLRNTVGVHKFYGVAQNSTTLQIKRSTSPTDITIDNIKVKRLNGDDTPRIDYTDGGCPVLLTEPQRTNLVTDSNDFSAWNQIQNVDLTPNSTTSPSGENDATKFLSTTGSSKIRESVSMVSGTTYTFSVYIKNIDATSIRLLAYDGVNEFSEHVQSQVNTSTWSRASFTFTALNTTSSGQIQIARDLPDGESIYIYGAQLEELSYATSYIPTYGAVRTRLQDTVRGAGTVSDINSAEGVLFAEISGLGTQGSSQTIGMFSDSGTGYSSRVLFRRNPINNKIQALVYVNSAIQFNITSPTLQNEFNKVALKYKENDFALWINGIEIGTDNSGLTPSVPLSGVSFKDEAIGNPFFGKTSQMQVFKTALSDHELELLTTDNVDYASYATMASFLNYNIS